MPSEWASGRPLRRFQQVPWLMPDALGTANALRSSKSDSKVRIEPEKAGHRVFPGGPPSKYYPGPTMLNFRDLTRSGVFIVVWTCHDRVSFLRVFDPCRLASLKPSKVRPIFFGFVPRTACFGSGKAYYRNWQPPDGLCSVLEDCHEPVAGVPRLAGAWKAFKVRLKSSKMG